MVSSLPSPQQEAHDVWARPNKKTKLSDSTIGRVLSTRNGLFVPSDICFTPAALPAQHRRGKQHTNSERSENAGCIDNKHPYNCFVTVRREAKLPNVDWCSHSGSNPPAPRKHANLATPPNNTPAGKMAHAIKNTGTWHYCSSIVHLARVPKYQKNTQYGRARPPKSPEPTYTKRMTTTETMSGQGITHKIPLARPGFGRAATQ